MDGQHKCFTVNVSSTKGSSINPGIFKREGTYDDALSAKRYSRSSVDMGGGGVHKSAKKRTVFMDDP